MSPLFFKIVLAILGLSNLHVNLRISVSMPRRASGILGGSAPNRIEPSEQGAGLLIHGVGCVFRPTPEARGQWIDSIGVFDANLEFHSQRKYLYRFIKENAVSI